MLKRFRIACITIGICLCIGIFAFSHFKRNPSTKDSSYFKPIHVTKWTKGDSPCLLIQLGERIISAQLDLGFRGDCSIGSELLDQINDKKKIGSKIMYGFQGKPERKNVFQLPNIRIGSQSFDLPRAQEEAQDYRARASFTKDGSKPSPGQPARIGWEMFQNTPLLLDLKNQKIAFCDSIATLKKEGYAIKRFVHTPLMLERGLVEVEVQTDKGSLRCVLDTGCTFNVLNGENEQNKSMPELLWNEENFYTSTKFQINNAEFGPVTFRQFPIRIPIHIDAMLGMEFLLDHIIFLDFPNHVAYFYCSGY